MNFDNFDGIFDALFTYAPDDVLTVTAHTDGTWGADLDYGGTDGAPSPVDAIGIVLMAFVRDEELNFFNIEEVNKVLSNTVGTFMEKASPSLTVPVKYEVYRHDLGLRGQEWEAALVCEHDEIEVYTIERGTSPGEALRNVIRTVATYPDAQVRRQRRDTPVAIAQFAPPPDAESEDDD